MDSESINLGSNPSLPANKNFMNRVLKHKLAVLRMATLLQFIKAYPFVIWNEYKEKKRTKKEMCGQKRDIIEKYKNKHLGEESFGKGYKFKVEDFINRNYLSYYMWEINDREADLSEDGIAFLKEYYTFDELAKILVSLGCFQGSGIETEEEVLEWLKSETAFPFD